MIGAAHGTDGISPVSVARQHLALLALRGLVTVAYRDDDLICGVPDSAGAVDWIRVFACQHVSRFVQYRSDVEALFCEVCHEARVSALNAGDLVQRLDHVASVSLHRGDAARCLSHQSGGR